MAAPPLAACAYIFTAHGRVRGKEVPVAPAGLGDHAQYGRLLLTKYGSRHGSRCEEQTSGSGSGSGLGDDVLRTSTAVHTHSLQLLVQGLALGCTRRDSGSPPPRPQHSLWLSARRTSPRSFTGTCAKIPDLLQISRMDIGAKSMRHPRRMSMCSAVPGHACVSGEGVSDVSRRTIVSSLRVC